MRKMLVSLGLGFVAGVVDTRLLKSYGSWIYCNSCNKTVGYLCYTTYDYFAISSNTSDLRTTENRPRVALVILKPCSRIYKVFCGKIGDVPKIVFPGLHNKV